MVADVRQNLDKRPFVPFSIVTTGGNRYRVATADHADIDPRGTRLMIWLDDEGSVIVPGLHIASVEREGARAA